MKEKTKVPRKILFTPGPVTTTDSVKESLIVPDICPREKEFCDVMKSIRNDLVKISGGNEHTCILFSGSGTAGMEAVISSCIHTNSKVLIITNGAYGKRFCKIAEYHNIDFFELSFNYGEKIDVDAIHVLLESEMFSHVVVVHHETTTGILNDIYSIGNLAKIYNCVYIVDAISSFAGIPFSVEECKIDFVISTSNKCLHGMPGIVFVIAKKSELEKTKGLSRTLYFDLYEQNKYFEQTGQMRFTPPVQVIYALRHAIDELGNVNDRYEQYKKNHTCLVRGMKARGFKLFLSDDVQHSQMIETFYLPKNIDFDKMHDALYEKGFTIYPGKLTKENTFRLGNIGDISPIDINRFFDELDKVIS